MISLDRPGFLIFLILLFIIPVIEITHFVLSKKRELKYSRGFKDNLLEFSSFATIKTRLFKSGLLSLALTALVLSMTAPYQSRSVRMQKTKVFPHVALVDVSRSMDVADYDHGLMTRIEKVKRELKLLYQAYPNVLAGLVSYASSPLVQGDVTTDSDALRFIASHWLKVGSAPGTGSDLPKGLRAALTLVTEHNLENSTQIKHILLFSDGGVGNPIAIRKVLADIKEAGIALIVFGIGTSEGGMVPIRSSDGQVMGHFSPDGVKAHISRLNEESLVSIASASGGKYTRLVNGGESVEVTKKYLREGKTETTNKNFLTWYFVFAGLVFFLLFIAVTRF